MSALTTPGTAHLVSGPMTSRMAAIGLARPGLAGGSTWSSAKQLGFRSNPPSTELAPAETWLGAPVNSLLAFTYAGQTVMADMAGYAQTQAAAYAGFGRWINWAIGLNVAGVPLADVASGVYDSVFFAIAQAIASYAVQPIIPARLGWEFNLYPAGTYYPWSANGVEAAYIAAFRRVALIFRAVSTRFRIGWVPNCTFGNPTVYNPALAWPGGDVVDYIGMDTYLIYALDVVPDAGATLDAKIYDAVNFKFTSTYGLNWLYGYAATQGKPLALDEWGVNLDYAEYFVAKFAAYIRAQRVLFHGYWDQNNPGQPNYQDKLSGNAYPATGLQFQVEFGPITIYTPSAVNAAQDGDTYIALTASKPVTWSIAAAPAGYSLVGNALLVSASAASHTVAITATDERGLTATLSLAVTMVASLAAWTPAAISAQLDLWLDVADAATITSAGGTCSQITDKSGNSHTGTQATGANQPAYSTTARNNLPGLTFDGSNDWMGLASASTLVAAGAKRAAFIAFFSNAADSSGFKYTWGLADNASTTIARTGTGSGTLRVFANTGQNTAVSVAGTDVVASALWDSTATPGQLQLINTTVNGTAVPSMSLTSASVSLTRATIGARPAGASGAADFCDHILKELILLKNSANTYLVALVVGYLAWKWGASSVAALPSDFPFKQAAPKLVS